ncbi:alpha/beta fold hydrolase [Haloplanus sp. GCM10025708]|uniref:alpha/beta fold hydrolase n=1 Tax=Haloplanus sp. GCM10025708 TaxID=3252679 RepID=UPI0036142615
MSDTTAEAADELRTVSVDGGRRVSYATYGDPDGTPVVFLHGTPGSRRLGALFDAAAGRRGVCLVAPDRPGFGASSPWPDRALDDTAAFLAPVLDDAGVDAAPVVGFSGGGPHALAMAAAEPTRVDAISLVASAVPPSVESDPPWSRRLVAALADRTPRLLGVTLRFQAAIAARSSPAFVASQYTADEREVPGDVAETVKRDFLEGFDAGASGAVTEFDLLSTPGSTCSTTSTVPFSSGTATPTPLSRSTAHVDSTSDWDGVG